MHKVLCQRQLLLYVDIVMYLNANITGSETLRRVRITIIAMEKQYALNIKSVCLYFCLSCPECKLHLSCAGKKKSLNVKYVLGFSLQTLKEFPFCGELN
jgi:hypothetical protein